ASSRVAPTSRVRPSSACCCRSTSCCSAPIWRSCSASRASSCCRRSSCAPSCAQTLPASSSEQPASNGQANRAPHGVGDGARESQRGGGGGCLFIAYVPVAGARPLQSAQRAGGGGLQRLRHFQRLQHPQRVAARLERALHL